MMSEEEWQQFLRLNILHFPYLALWIQERLGRSLEDVVSWEFQQEPVESAYGIYDEEKSASPFKRVVPGATIIRVQFVDGSVETSSDPLLRTYVPLSILDEADNETQNIR